MRYLKILLLHFEHIMEHRVRSFVWFFVSSINPLIFILYWVGAYEDKKEVLAGWNLSSMTSYYFLLTIIAAALMSHIENDVAREDIQEGRLTQYLLKPYPYYILKFMEEIHYRVLQGGYGVLTIVLLSFIFGPLVTVSHSIIILLLFVVVAFLAISLTYAFKLVVGFIAFWTTDIMGMFFLVDIILIFLAGYIVPIQFLIYPFDKIANMLPFAYMIYYPVLVLQGKLSVLQTISVIGIQFFWLSFFSASSLLMWKKGIKTFAGVGQ